MIESTSVRRALSRLRDEISPTSDDKARLRARILAPLGLPGPESPAQDAAQAATAQSAARAASLTPWAALKAAGSVGAVAGLTLLGAGGGLGFWLGQEVTSARMQSVAAFEAPARTEASAPLPGPAIGTPPWRASEMASSDAVAADAPALGTSPEAARPSASRPVDVPPRAHAARRRAEPNPLEAELGLLRRVERALRNNDPALARALLGELDERYPDSRLGEERSAARRIADCRSGEPGASESARAFLRQHGASVYRKRIVLACALDGEPRSEAAAMKNAESADTHVR